MPAFAYVNFQASTSFPPGFNTTGTPTIDVSAAVSGGGSNSLLNNAGTVHRAVATTPDGLAGNFRLSANVKVLAPIAAGTYLRLITRCSVADPATLFTSPNASVFMQIPLGVTQTAITTQRRPGSPGAASIGSGTLTGNPLTPGETYQVTYQPNGVSHSIEIKCLTGTNAGKWLKSSKDGWQSTVVACFACTDGTAFGGDPVTGAGYWGWDIVSESGSPNSSIYLDEVRLTTLNGVNGSITPPAPTISAGTTVALGTVNYPAGTWSSLNPSVATVDPSTGVVTGVSAGTASIKFTSGVVSSETSTATVTVTASTNATGYTLSVSSPSTTVNTPITVTATLTGGTSLTSALVINLVDSLTSTILGSITINPGSTTGTTTITPNVAGTHSITASHTGGGFAGGDGSTSFVATQATGYALSASIGAVGVGDTVTITATLDAPGLASDLVINLADDHGSSISGPITIPVGSTTGTATAIALVDGTHLITASHTGGGFAGGDGSTSFTAGMNAPLFTRRNVRTARGR
ncbi:Ig-like domain-containing protein [Tundrisphaera lichenicola]|uniref:Ig-like domain-containing protein n=1 Tax=Tundrisphaera lichenicola TaxID=2029860 RepID=UPI003EBCCD5C